MQSTKVIPDMHLYLLVLLVIILWHKTGVLATYSYNLSAIGRLFDMYARPKRSFTETGDISSKLLT